MKLITLEAALAMRAAHNADPPTTLPWEVCERQDQEGNTLAWWIDAPEAGCEKVASVPAEDGAQADAHYIVAAANAHADLFETVIALHGEVARLRAALADAFFDRPPAWTRDRRVQVLLGIGNAACAGVALWGDVAFARVVACTLYLSIALQMFARAWSRRASR